MPQSLRHLSLFAGIGGFEEGIKITSGDIITKQFVELDADAQTWERWRSRSVRFALSAAPMRRSHHPDIPIHSDIRDFSPRTGEFDFYTIG